MVKSRNMSILFSLSITLKILPVDNFDNSRCEIKPNIKPYKGQ